MKALTFQNITLTPIKTDSQIWLTSGELAKALNYADQSSVNKIYDRNADEFSDSMTALIPNPQMKNAKIRIFSLRGCHLVAMLSKTKIAKAFRQWVLDILDKEVGQPKIERITISIEQQQAIRQAIAQRCKDNSLHYQTIYTAMYEHFDIPRYNELLAIDFDKAINFINTINIAPQQDNSEYNAKWRMVGLLEYNRISHEMREIGQLINEINNRFHRLTKSTGLVYDALNEQRIPTTDPKQRMVEAKTLIEHNHALKARYH